jgi:hypothetical protein
MPILKNLFHSGKTNEGITSLDLEVAKPQSSPENFSSNNQKQIDPMLLAVSVPEISRRAKVMMEAEKRPQSLSLAIDGATNGMVTFRTTNPDRTAMLIFTSGHTAMDYLKTSNISGDVHMFPFESLHTYIDLWRKAKVDTFVFDRCPRCPDFVSLPINDNTEGQFLTLWTLHRATRDFQSERRIRAYLNSSNASKKAGGAPADTLREMRNHLETLRDHINYSIPYVHWLIAILAGVQGDHEAQADSIRNLEAFGPSFIGKVPPDKPFVLETSAKSQSEALVGLLATFGMLPPAPQSAGKITETKIN